MKTCHINVKELAKVLFTLKNLELQRDSAICLFSDSQVVVSVGEKLGSAKSLKLRKARILRNKN